jgi:hypothetical protein
MEKKRSKGVTFWAWFFIISSLIGLILVINPKQQVQFYGIARGVVMYLVYFICGIYLLKLNDYARKAVIVLGIISIISFPFIFMPALNKMNFDDYYAKKKRIIMEQYKPESQQKALENLEKIKESSKKFVPIFVTVTFGLPYLIYILIPIYFFTRPKVKRQFTGAESPQQSGGDKGAV